MIAYITDYMLSHSIYKITKLFYMPINKNFLRMIFLIINFSLIVPSRAHSENALEDDNYYETYRNDMKWKYS